MASSPSSSAQALLDLSGLVLTGVAIGWAYLAAAISGGDADPFVVLLLASASAFVLARITVHWNPSLVPVAVIIIAGVLAMRAPNLLSAHPLSGPFSYTNATGAYYLQAAIAGAMLAAAARSVPTKVLGLLAAIAFGLVPFAVRSLTAAILVLVVPFAVLASRVLRGTTVVAASAVAFAAVLAATIVLGATYTETNRSALLDRVVDSTLTERRAALWHEALLMMRDHPVTGVGLGGFQELSPTARSDRDARWAHNSFLQHGAETGLIGLISLILLFAWGFAIVGGTGSLGVLSVLAAVAVAALGIHASVDYVLHFPAIPITTAALVGTAGVGQRGPQTLFGKRTGQAPDRTESGTSEGR